MISTRKKLVYGMVLVAASGLFANELVNATRSEPSFTPIERAADAESAALPMPDDTPQEQAPSFDDPAEQLGDSPATSVAQPKPELGDVLAALESALERLDSRPAGADGRRVDALVRQQRSRNGADRASDARAVQSSSAASMSEFVDAPLSADDSAPRRRDESERRARLERFLEESPLSGVLCSGGTGVAMFGGRIVRTGENLLGDDGRVNACTPQGVGVLLAGREVWIPMPDVRVRPAAGPAAGAAAAPPAGPAAPAAAAPSVAPSAAPNGAASVPRPDASTDAASSRTNRGDSERSGGQQ